MGRAIGTNKSGAINREADRERLDRDVMHDLVVAALQEGGIDRRERLVAFRRQPGAEGHRMLFGNADIEGALGKFLLEQVEAGAGRHRGGNRDDFRILFRFLDQALGEDFCVNGRIRLRLGLRAGRDVEFDNAMIFVGGDFGRAIALALLGDDMDQDRAGFRVAHVFQHGQEMIEIMSVDRTDIIEAELLEQGAAGHHAAGIFLGADRALLEEFRQVRGELFADLAQRTIGFPGDQPRQISRHRADRRGNRHVIVVEHDDQPRIHRAGIVHGFVGHAGRHRAVADHGDDIVLLAVEVARDRHAETRTRSRSRNAPRRTDRIRSRRAW